MAMLQFFERSSNGPVSIASYTATETIKIMPANVGELIGYGCARTTLVFDGTNSDSTFIVGDDNITNRFFEDGDIDEHTVGFYAGTGVGMDNSYLYTTANTIDVVYTTDTASDETEGLIDVWFYIARVFPH